MSIRILLVDDHPVVLEGLSKALGGQEGLEVVAVAKTLEEARATLARTEVDVGLVDVRLPDGFGLELIASTRQNAAGPAWIVLSTYELAEYVVAAIERGASGYLLKTAPLPDIVRAIERVAAGETAFESKHLAALRAGRIRLSSRERQVVAGVLAGRSNDEIATGLGVARKTVEAYVSRLLERAEVTSRTELALRAEREGWLDLGDPAARRA
jgi:DNA-binding NarL/FixJ family response regulator